LARNHKGCKIKTCHWYFLLILISIQKSSGSWWLSTSCILGKAWKGGGGSSDIFSWHHFRWATACLGHICCGYFLTQYGLALLVVAPWIWHEIILQKCYVEYHWKLWFLILLLWNILFSMELKIDKSNIFEIFL